MDAKKKAEEGDGEEWSVDLDRLLVEMRRADEEPGPNDAPQPSSSGVRPIPTERDLTQLFDDEDDAPTDEITAPGPKIEPVETVLASKPTDSAAVVVSPPLPGKRRRLAVIVPIVVAIGAALGWSSTARIATAPAPARLVATAVATERARTDQEPPEMAPSSLPAASPTTNAITTHALAPVAAKPEPAAMIALVDLPTSATDANANLGTAMKDAVGAHEHASGAKPEAASPIPRNLRPPAGAVNAAINAALPAARICLPEHASIVHAAITFDANGAATATVRDASPETAPCIARALSTPHIDPFVEAPYTVAVAVRP